MMPVLLLSLTHTHILLNSIQFGFGVVVFCISFFSCLLLCVRACAHSDTAGCYFLLILNGFYFIICNALLVVTKISKYLFALYYLCMIAYFSFSIFSYFLGVFVVLDIYIFIYIVMVIAVVSFSHRGRMKNT